MKNEWLIKFGGFSELRAFGRVVLFKHWSTFSNPFFTHTHTHALSEEVWGYLLISVQFIQSCPTVCDPMNCSTPGFPIHHQLPKLAQTHVHWVGDAIQPSHPLLSPFPPAFNPPSIRVFSNVQLFALGSQSTGVSASTSVLPMNIQDWSPLGWTGWISLQSKGLSRVFSNTIVQKHQFFSIQLSL